MCSVLASVGSAFVAQAVVDEHVVEALAHERPRSPVEQAPALVEQELAGGEQEAVPAVEVVVDLREVRGRECGGVVPNASSG